MLKSFDGVYSVMPTPFDDGGRLDLGSIETLVNFLVNAGVQGIVLLGVLGEAHKLSDQEQDLVIQTATRTANGRVSVFAGSGTAETKTVIEKGSRALEQGVEGVLVAPPAGQDENAHFDHFSRIDKAIAAPLIVHDWPTATGGQLPVPLIQKLFEELEHIRAVKLEDAPTNVKLSALKARCPSLSALGGLGGLYAYEELLRGSNGIMTGFSFPDILVSIYTHFIQGARERAAELFFQACPLMRYEFQPQIGLALRKEIYRRRGAIRSSHVRAPGMQIDRQLEAELDFILCNSELGV